MTALGSGVIEHSGPLHCTGFIQIAGRKVALLWSEMPDQVDRSQIGPIF